MWGQKQSGRILRYAVALALALLLAITFSMPIQMQPSMDQ
jgi:hypothetical protein